MQVIQKGRCQMPVDRVWMNLHNALFDVDAVVSSVVQASAHWAERVR